MKSVASKAVACAAAVFILVAAPSFGQTAAKPLTFRTALVGIARGETLYVRVREAGRGSYTALIVFRNEREEEIGREAQHLAPGQPATFKLPYAALATDDPFPAVATSLVLTPEGSAARRAVFVHAELFNNDTLLARGSWSCAPPHQGVGVEFICDDGINATNAVIAP